MSESNNRTIGGFRILQEIQAGSGSQGTVYKAVCEDDRHGFVSKGTLVALKVMAVQDDAKRHWKKLESRTLELSRLNHPNVVRYYGCFSESGLFNDVHVVVQEFLDGETLKERLAGQKSGLDVDYALKVSDAALSGLEYVSRCGIVHRDIKPGNIFLCRNGAVKLIDFEIARQRGGTTTSTAGNIRGSFDYMAPDFTDPEFHGDEKSDVFSMGVVVHEILTGKTPYQRLEGEGKQANFAFLSRWSRALSDGSNPIYVSSRVKRLLANASEAIEKALSPKREDRYPGFSGFREDLKKVKFRTLRNGSRSYQMLQFIGKGGFGEVFKARERGTGELVAVKHLLKAAYAERFMREAKIMKKLDDPCFVRLVDFFTMDVGNSSEAFLVMAFLDGMPGSSLRDAIRASADGGLDPRDVFTAFKRYAHGLSVMHASGIFHRDIKPSNLYYPAGRVACAAIMDLGIARDVNGTATHGQVPGTLDYMPPEVVLTDNRGDGGMDVYALGLCLYEALTGKTAYPRLPTGTASYTAFFERARSKALPSFSAPGVATDAEVLELLRDMTNPDQHLRIKDAATVAVRLGNLLEARFGGAVPDVPAGCADNGASDSPETSATMAVADVQTAATQWGGGLPDDIVWERRRYLLKRFKAALLALLVALSGVGVFLAWRPVSEHLAARAEITAAVSAFNARIRSCVGQDGRLHEGNFAELEKIRVPDSQPVFSSLSDSLAALGIALSASVRANLAVEPPLTRRNRIGRARGLLGGRWAELALSPGDLTQLNQEIQNAESWCVGVVKNGCSNPIRVDGSEIPAGGSKVVVYEDGHPENGMVSLAGFNTIHLPRDIDGRVHEITEAAFTAKPVRFTLPAFGSDVRCELDGRIRNSGETLELLPGYYKCRYLRDTYKTQEMAFSVYANAEVTVPEPKPWAHTEEFLKIEKQRREEKARFEQNEQKRIFEAKAKFEESLKKLLSEEPVATRIKRLDEAKSAIAAARKDNVIPESAAAEGIKDVDERRRWTVGRIRNSGNSDVIAAGRRLAPGASELVVFKNGLPSDWTYSASGYEKSPLPQDFEGRTVDVSVADLDPALVAVRCVPAGHGVTCLFDGKEVSADLKLKPGRHSCVYRKNGYRDQTLAFEVLHGMPRTLPVPGEWIANPVKVAVPALPAGVVCKVDGVDAGTGVFLPPGDHLCVYSRDDYEDQSFEFKVAPATEMPLPAPGSWVSAPGLKRLEAAESAVKEGDWTKAKTAIAFAEVVAPANVARKKAVEEKIANQSKLAERREKAEMYFEEGLYYDAVKYYCEAFETGYALSAKDMTNFEHAYSTAKKRLQKLIDRCHKDIALGKSPIRPLDDLEAEMRQLIGWRTKVRGLR